MNDEHTYRVMYFTAKNEHTIIDAGPDIKIKLVGPEIDLELPIGLDKIIIDRYRLEDY